jgi:hypothetical protein
MATMAIGIGTTFRYWLEEMSQDPAYECTKAPAISSAAFLPTYGKELSTDAPHRSATSVNFL